MPTAVITGASQGLGRALAADLAAAGWTLVLDARTAPTLTAVARELGPNVLAIPGDVTDPQHRYAIAAGNIRRAHAEQATRPDDETRRAHVARATQCNHRC